MILIDFLFIVVLPIVFAHIVGARPFRFFGGW